MPTLYEVFFWVAALFTVISLWGVFATGENDLYVSNYELDRLNGNKY